ncbi:MAG: ribosome maturation factor RimP [Acidobacteria bacterium]|nr:ribosome maturation factor RimP [Acidobacteriota bacterium]
MSVSTRVEDLIRDTVAAEGYELVHVNFQPRGAASILRVYIDKPGGINLDDCGRVSKHLSVLLDVEDVIPHSYVLEVSSPGIERPLFKEEDYHRFKGQEIRLVATEKIDGRTHFTGWIRAVSGGIVDLECENEIVHIPFSKVRRANLIYRGVDQAK